MNETLENVMTFINENTNILIGICLFLIFVLVGYLIDNSIKTRRIKKQLKNNKNSNMYISDNEELNNNDETLESLPNLDILENKDDTISNTDKFVDVISTPDNTPSTDIADNKNIELEKVINDELSKINDSESIDIPLSLEEKNNNITPDIMKDINNNSNILDTNVKKEPEKEKLDSVDVIYKNDKKLSEILFDNTNQSDVKDLSKDQKLQDNIFDSNTEEISVDTSKKISDIEIEEKEDELDKIMKKLENINNVNLGEDDYTNIF